MVNAAHVFHVRLQPASPLFPIVQPAPVYRMQAPRIPGDAMPAVDRNKLMWRLRVALGGLALLAGLSARAAPAALPVLDIDIAQSSVSGLSSGGFMAVQFAVAYSSIVKGAGVIAGGPYYCARGQINLATMVCTCTTAPIFGMCMVTPGGTRVEELIGITDRNAGERLIDPAAGLARQRYWLFSGSADSVVPQAVMNDLHVYLRHYVDARRIHYENQVRAQHAMPTDSFGNACDTLAAPYIGNCSYDAAGQLLQWIYDGALNERSAAAPAGRLLEFDQHPFVESGNAAGFGLADTGFIYIPPGCGSGETGGCRLHIAFHGCSQNVASVGDSFIRHAGYNRWADTNKLIVLYPQTIATRNNPKACWNWFDAEHDDAAYATRDGRQMKAIKHMADRIAGMPMSSGGGPAAEECFTSSNFGHIRAGRAHLDFFLWTRANGSNAGLGFAYTLGRTTLRRTGENYYVNGKCP
jgi:poly(3-hydroxybutyrate) depolymerase